jgi:UDP:flavonoid glycosyltransferase YjiC (YdhE family)
MSHVVFAWELGYGLGHIAPLAALGREFEHRGHTVSFILRDLSRIGSLLDPGRVACFQAPIWLGRPTASAPPPATYADILLTHGYADPQFVRGRAWAWRRLLTALDVDLLVFDHAPTALLASEGMGMARVLYGSTFCVPPQTDPLPRMQWWERRGAENFHEREQLALNTLNTLRREMGNRELGNVASLFDTDANFLLGAEALDHYPQRSGGTYYGPAPAPRHGSSEIEWPRQGKLRLFVYLSPDYAVIDSLLAALAKSPYSILVYAPGLSPQQRKAFASDHLVMLGQPVDLSEIGKQCDAALGYGGAGATLALLAAGCPLILLPRHSEQLMLAKRAEQLGVAAVVSAPEVYQDYPKLLRSVLSDQRYKQAAVRFAATQPECIADQTATNIADRCEELIAERTRRA